MISKIWPVSVSLAAALANPQCLMLPEAVLDNAKAALEKLQDLEKRAKLNMDGTQTDMNITKVQDANPMVAAAKKAEALLKAMISTVGRLGV